MPYQVFAVYFVVDSSLPFPSSSISSIDASQERLGAAIRPVEARMASIELESTSKRTARQALRPESRHF
jgi:hypothetical protein